MKNKILIMSQARSGSTYTSELAELTKIKNVIYSPYGENTLKEISSDTEAAIKEQTRRILSFDECIIKDNRFYWAETPFRDQFNAEMKKCLAEVREHIKENYHIIKIFRNDLFEITLSKMIAHQKDIWHARNHPFPPEKFTLDISTFDETYLNTVKNYNRLKNCPFGDVIINYEDYTSDPKIDYYKLGIDIEPENFEITLVKNRDKRTIVENYDEIKQYYIEKFQKNG